jgi:hypothetical protein
MSKVAIKGATTGTATFTIESPATNTDRTLVLPDNAGTVLTSASDLAAANLTGNVAAARITDALNASGSAPIYACRAWVSFNGNNQSGIRVSGNVSSVTRVSTGDYTINLANAMPDTNYSVSGMAGADTDGARNVGVSFDDINLTPTTSAFRINVRNRNANSNVNTAFVFVQVFR